MYESCDVFYSVLHWPCKIWLLAKTNQVDHTFTFSFYWPTYRFLLVWCHVVSWPGGYTCRNCLVTLGSILGLFHYDRVIGTSQSNCSMSNYWGGPLLVWMLIGDNWSHVEAITSIYGRRRSCWNPGDICKVPWKARNVTRFSIGYICLGTRLGVMSPNPWANSSSRNNQWNHRAALIEIKRKSENKHFNCTAQSDAMKFIIWQICNSTQGFITSASPKMWTCDTRTFLLLWAAWGLGTRLYSNIVLTSLIPRPSWKQKGGSGKWVGVEVYTAEFSIMKQITATVEILCMHPHMHTPTHTHTHAHTHTHSTHSHTH